MPFPSHASLAVAAVLIAAPAVLAQAAPPETSKAVRTDEGKSFDANEAPTYSIKSDGTVDWYTFSGYRRFHAECHVCHGPDGLGSTYAPSLVETMGRLDYAQFLDVVVNGRKNLAAGKESVMPALGEDKPASVTESEKSCMSG